jgi:hypothetical protein
MSIEESRMRQRNNFCQASLGEADFEPLRAGIFPNSGQFFPGNVLPDYNSPLKVVIDIKK